MPVRRSVAVGAALIVVVTAVSCTDDDAALCARLSEAPQGLSVIHWSNGVTSSRATWSTTLADGVVHGSDDTRREMADALAADDEGYRWMVARVGHDDRWAFDHLHEAALDPTRSGQARDLDRTRAAAQVIWDLERETCGRV